MKNKINLKRCLLQCLFVSLMFLLFLLGFQWKAYREYTIHYNQKISAILERVHEKYPDITKAELMEILSDGENEDSNEPETSFVRTFGIDLKKDSIILENEMVFLHSMLLVGLSAVLFACVLVGAFLKYNRDKDKELKQITRYIEEINQRNYTLDIEDISEDELSILKNEIYKTTVMLNEIAENSLKDKLRLKNSLSDISHQLKTPLTSILIILENLIDEPEMDASLRADFLQDIKRETRNISFLVQSLLKLSKLDSDTVVFLREEVSVKKIVEAAVSNVSMLCELKNIKIEVEKAATEPAITCDFRWQVEAVTNILKNCVEHSPDGESVIIKIEKSNIYTSISIRDFGDGIDEEDQKHIFERFYKGKNASPDSVGIGLALAKAIVEADSGSIGMKSGENGTTFVVQYL